MAGVSLALLVGALVASGIAESNEPNGPAIVVPAGYQEVRDGYFTYAVPSAWTLNGEYSDQTGDVDNSGPDGWAAQHIGFRSTPPLPGEAQPSSLEAFGMPRPEPYHLSTATPVKVTGASAAYRYELTRPGGFSATVIDAWDQRSAVELWLVVYATPSTTAQIVASLRG
jgi:hypothetical protein